MKNITITSLKVGELEENCYLVTNNTSKETAIIDPGDSAEYITEVILRNEMVPKMILATHGHFDHILAVLELKLAFNIPFYIHKKDQFLVQRMKETSIHFTGFDPGPPPTPDFFLDDKSEIKLAILKFKVIYTPGHTPGGVSFYQKEGKAVFVGDLIFKGGELGRTDFSYSNKKDFRRSVEKITKLSKDTTVFPGHGEEFRLEDLHI